MRSTLILFALSAVLLTACSGPPPEKGGQNSVIIIDNNSNSSSNNVVITECGPGRSLCNGACIDTTLDSANCGSCGQSCGTGTVCSQSTCAPVPTDCRVEGTCPARYFCDENTGLCEVGCSTNADCPAGSFCELASHACLCSGEGLVVCGSECVAESPLSCGTSCETCPPIANGDALCTDGACAQQCDDGYLMCDGKCSACPSGAGVVGIGCLGDQCVATECAPDHEICEGTCAACPATSGSESLGCEGAECVITNCPQDTKLCNGICAPCPTDPAGSTTCQGQACVLVCSNGYHSCGDYCAFDDDATACGAGCQYCPTDNNGTAVCESGSCGLDCDTGYRACQGTCASCPSGPGVVNTTCAGASCVVSSCAAGYMPCTGGCCRNAPHGVAFDYNQAITDVSIAVDGRGYPHMGMASASGNSVYYVYWDGSAWQNEYVTSGWAADIALDTMGRPRMAIWKRNPDGAWYASRDPVNGWSVEEVDNTFNDVGMTPDLVMVGNTPHIAYYDFEAGDLRYAVKSGNSWTNSIVVSQNEVGFSPTLAFVGATPHIVYRDETNNVPRHSWYSGSSWSAATVDDMYDAGSYSSLAADSGGDLHLAYVVWTNTQGDQIHYTEGTGGSWPFSYTFVANGGRPSLVLDGQESPVIVYWQRAGNLGMASAASGWTQVTLDTVQGGESNHAVYDALSNKVHVVYDDYAADDLKYITFTP